MNPRKRIRVGQVCRVHRVGYVFGGMRVRVVSFISDLPDVAICCEIEEEAAEKYAEKYHLILTRWLVPEPARCECCGQILPKED